LQEAVNKIAEVHELRPELHLDWHFIGPIQSNKTRPIAENFSWVHAVDREKIAQRLSEQRPEGLPPLNICLQVNVSGEASKSGVSPEELSVLAKAVVGLPNIQLRGLMAIPEPEADLVKQRAPFALLRELQQQLAAMGIATDTLSMGMSGDMQAAIMEGATMVRIGSAIFGKRDYAN
jgi:pyridoxal phosphate enzyme (YggS family)